MQTKLNHLTTSQQANLTALLGVIIKSVQPTKIICYGYHHWNRQFSRASCFYKGAAYYQSLHEGEAAVFCLHQSVEQTAIAVLKAITGYKAETHNLARLFVLLDQLGLQASAVFPNNSPEEKDLLNTLKNAYSASRYAEDYKVPPQTADILFNRVGQLLQQAEAFYSRVTQNWQTMQDQQFPLSVAFVNTLNSAS